MRKLISLLMLMLCAAQATAAEHITSFGSGTVHTGWTWSTNKYVGSNVWAQRIDFADATMLAGHTYRYSVTIANRSAGSLQVMLGAPKGVAMGTDIPTVDLQGLAPIADNFTTSNGVFSSGVNPADSDHDPNGAMRFRCGYDKFALDDPLVYPGQPGRSHLHINYGNRGFNANSTYESLRKSGGTSCGKNSAPIYRTAFWTPAMLDGRGNALVPKSNDIYYKTIPSSNGVCKANTPGQTYDAAVDTTKIGICLDHLPNGIRYVFGYNMGSMSGGPTDGDPMWFTCGKIDDAAQNAPSLPGGGNFTSMKAMYDAGCRSPATIATVITGASCWDGQYIDKVNHRDHVSAYTGALRTINWTTLGVAQGPSVWAACPTSHPYVIPTAELHLFYAADEAWDAGLWRLSSDEQMGMPMDAGTTLHMDYFEAWSPSAKATWETNCIGGHRTCANGELGDGTSIRGENSNSLYMTNFADPRTGTTSRVSLTKFGYSRLLQANGTFTGEITPTASGNIALYSPDGFTGDVTALSITDVTKRTTYTPVTVHGTKN